MTQQKGASHNISIKPRESKTERKDKLVTNGKCSSSIYFTNILSIATFIMILVSKRIIQGKS